MTHLDDDALVLHQYGEDEDHAAAAAHLSECEECGARQAVLRRVLAAAADLPVPERGPEYGAAVWARLAPRLAAEPRATGPGACVLRFPWRGRPAGRWVAAAAVAASLVAAFSLGRHSRPQPEPISGEVRARILLVAVGDHLERSRMVLVELANAPVDGPVDVTSEQQWAQALVADNRIYRHTAAREGERAVASVLDELERVLIAVANGPAILEQKEYEALCQRIEAQGILFKVHVLGSQVRERGRPPAGVSASPGVLL